MKKSEFNVYLHHRVTKSQKVKLNKEAKRLKSSESAVIRHFIDKEIPIKQLEK